MSWRQVSIPCSKCGSMYRRGEYCNICKSHEPVPVETETRFSYAGKECKGRQWSKTEHKYIIPGKK